MMIQIIIDPFGVNDATDDRSIVVDTQDQYVDACDQMNQAAEDEADLRVVVRNRAMHDWFDQYRGRTGVSIRTCDPCDILAGALDIGVAGLPNAMREDPRAIVDLGLIDLAKRLKRAEGQSPVSWILEATAGPPWGKASIETQADLDDLLTHIVKCGGVTPLHPTAIALQDQVRSQWSEAGPFASLLAWLFADHTVRRAEALIIARMMAKYPFETQLEALNFEGRWTELCQLEAHDAIVNSLGSFVRQGFAMPVGPNNIIRNYLSNRLAESGLKGVLPAISGYIAEEEKVLRSYLRDRVGEIDLSWEQDLASLRRVFAQSESASQLLEMISELKPVSEPGSCLLDACWEEVSDWLETQYFPYYRWAVAVNQLEKTEKAVTEFERWLLSNYDDLTRGDALLASCLRQSVIEQLKVGECLLVVVDGLPWSLAPIYGKLASESGLALLEAHPKVSIIPTVTEIAKPCLIRGQLPGHLTSTGVGTAYYHELLSQSVGLPKEEIACVSSNEGSLFELVRSHERLMLYMFNSADELVHKKLPADKRREKIEDQLSKLFDDLSEARQEHQDQGRGSLAMLIVSDHGYTEMPSTVGSCLQTPDGLRESHGRVVFGAIDELQESEGLHAIPPDHLGGGTTGYAVASAYNYFESRPHGATHGGLTPQEVIVPMLVVGDQTQLDFRSCEVAITGDINRGVSANLVKVSIVNPNETQVIVEHLDLRLTRMAEDGPWTLRPKGRIDIGGEVDASRVRTADLRITGSLTLRGPAGVQNVQIDTTMQTVGAAVADTRFDESFDL